MFATAETRLLNEEVVRGCIERPEWRKICRQTFHGEEPYLFGFAEVIEPVRAEVNQLSAGGKIAMGQLAGDAGKQYLAAMSDGHKPRHAVDGRPKVVGVALLCV